MRRFLRNTVMTALGLLLAASVAFASPGGDEAKGEETPNAGSAIHWEKVLTGKNVYLGISLAHVAHAEGTEKDGLYVSRVYEGSGAAEAGLREHDRILSVDGQTVREHGDVRRITSGKELGDVVEVVVRRGREETTFDVTLGELPHDDSGHGHKGPHYVLELQAAARPMIGIHAMTLTDQLAEYHEVPGGALVTRVVEGGPAWEAGIRAGDVVVRWNGEEVLGMDDIHSRLSRSNAGDVAEVEVIRRGSVQQHSVRLAEPGEIESSSINIRLADEEGEGLVLIHKDSGDDEE